MSDLILAVDDEPMVLRAYQRSLGDQFNLRTAEGPIAALEMLEAEEYAVILTDLKMPGMDGIDFLQGARTLRPDAVRLMISGHADMGDALNSINEAGVFRLMLKPCPTEKVAEALNAGLEQYRLITAERQLLESTLNGAIHTLTDILSLLDSEAYGQAQLRRGMARKLALELKQAPWNFEMAAQLADIGRASLPTALNEKIKNEQPLSEAETHMLEQVPEFSSNLLQRIPRLESVTEAILYQDKHFDGTGFPKDALANEQIPIAARVLHAIKALLALTAQGNSPEDAISFLKREPKRYDPAIVRALYACIHLLRKKSTGTGPLEIKLHKLAEGMVLLKDIRTTSGMMVLPTETRITQLHVQRIRNFAQFNRLEEPFLVEIPGQAGTVSNSA